MPRPTDGLRRLTATVLAVLAVSTADAAETEDLAAVVERAARPLMETHGAPGVAVGVTVDGERRVFAYGLASRATGRPTTGDTIFEIGSLSKTFTATLAALAVSRGRLSLDDAAETYLPELRGSPAGRARMIDLGTYAAGGLPLQFPDDAQDDAGAIAFLRRWKPTARPGERRRYSNPSLGLFGRAAARAMGGDFAGLIERELFPALGVTSSFVRVPATEEGRYAWGVNAKGAAVRVNPGAFDAEAYGVKSTASDMIRFVEANLDPERGAVASAIRATQVGYLKAGPLIQGLGWEQLPWPIALDGLIAANSETMTLNPQPASRLAPPREPSAPTLFGKTGSTGGFGAYAAFVPAARIGVVILANRNVPIPARLAAAHAILERLASGR